MTTLLVTATGGHLAELHQLVHRFSDPDEDRLWVTFDSPQSRDLLRDERVVYARTTPPRDVRGVVANLAPANRLLASEPFRRVISNGSGIALAYLPLARAKSLPVHYIECAARTQAPSVTGRFLERVPGVHLYAQYERWARGRWAFGGSVVDNFAATPRTPAPKVRRVLVTVGTLYPFRRLIERLRAVIPADVDVVWQVGATDVQGLGVDAHHSLPPRRLAELAATVDVVVAHSGIGSALLALQAGRLPILVPRERGSGEHVDDHQHELADELHARGLALSRRPDELTFADLEWAASVGIDRVAAAPFRLSDEPRPDGSTSGRPAATRP